MQIIKVGVWILHVNVVLPFRLWWERVFSIRHPIHNRSYRRISLLLVFFLAGR